MLAAIPFEDEDDAVQLANGTEFGLIAAVWTTQTFLPLTRRGEIGPDGHARRGGFLPPVPPPRRMGAGGAVRVLPPAARG